MNASDPVWLFSGGAIFLKESKLTAVSSSFRTNRNIGSLGGVAYVTAGSLFHCTSCLFEANVALDDRLFGSGGAISSWASKVHLESTVIRGGSHHLDAWSGGALHLDGSVLVATDVTFDGLSAARGGAIFDEGYSLINITNVSFIDTVADPSTISVDNDVDDWYYNSFDVGVGGSLFLNDDSFAIIHDSLFLNTTANESNASIGYLTYDAYATVQGGNSMSPDSWLLENPGNLRFCHLKECEYWTPSHDVDGISSVGFGNLGPQCNAIVLTIAAVDSYVDDGSSSKKSKTRSSENKTTIAIACGLAAVLAIIFGLLVAWWRKQLRQRKDVPAQESTMVELPDGGSSSKKTLA